MATGLGAGVDQLAAKSPTLERDIAKLQKDGWHIQYGPANQGSSTNKSGQPPTIVIDGSERGNPQAVVQGLAHETGHALYQGVPDYSTKTNYVNSELADEGAATMNNIKVQREIVTHGGPDIHIAGDPANAPAYNAAYNQFVQNGDANAARAAIGHVYGTGEHASVPVNGQYVNYQTYYGSWYDRNYPSH